MNTVKNLEGFLNALDHQIEGAILLLGDASAFMEASRVIEKLFAEEWPAIEAHLQEGGITDANRQRLQQTLESINALEAKTRARLTWSDDFEEHMRRAMETIT